MCLQLAASHALITKKGVALGSVCDVALERLTSWKHSSMQMFVVVLMTLLVIICQEAGKQSIFPPFYRLNRYNFAAAQNFGNGDDPSKLMTITNNVGVVQIVENGLRKYVCFSESFNMEAASAACRQVGFEKAIKFGRSGYGDFSR